MENHTPLPWKAELSTIYWNIDDDISNEDFIVCSTIKRTDADFIVRAANNFEQMLFNLKLAADSMQGLDDLQNEVLPYLIKSIALAEEINEK